MNSLADPQELVRRFNGDEAVWRSYLQNRVLRRLRGSWSPFSEEVLDRLDWLEAERECRKRRYIGRSVEEAVQSIHSQPPCRDRQDLARARTTLVDLYENLQPLQPPPDAPKRRIGF